ncbi:hypothetical protein HPB48_011608 [Haemaphysalis longicornis]|uniref:Uncharacterized protein n=1 Tax=Haemaphysalis longicornis TaxID=44386 RepID=A0A9J6GBY9_HAELO|nr:hypothetical protein HPB48_011608 [Haemaphysalis longicornis]
MVVDIETSEGFDCEQAFGSGHFQNHLTLFTAFSVLVVISHAVAFTLISAEVDHWCRQPTGGYLSADAWRNISIPVDPDGRHSKCMVYANPGDPNDTKVIECDAWDFDLERGKGSVISEWKLVCSRRSLKTLADVVFMAGSVVFLLLSGHFADRVGRLPVVLASASILTVATLGTCFAPSYPAYLVTRFLISGCTVSLNAVTGIILAECSSCARRSTLLSLSFLLGNLLADTYTRFLKWVRPSHWFYHQLAIVAPTLLVPVWSLLATESPRWLIASRRLEAAARVMRAAAQRNGSNTDGVDLLLQRVKRRLEAEIGADGATPLATDMVRVVRRRARSCSGLHFAPPPPFAR